MTTLTRIVWAVYALVAFVLTMDLLVWRPF